MSNPMVPISEASQRLLQELCAKTGQTPAEVLEKALDSYARKLFFEQLNAGYAEMRADPTAWAALEEERKVWDATLMDGLDSEENWTDDGRCLTPNVDED